MSMLPLDKPSPSVDTNQEIPKEMDIFFRDESEFLPPGKTWADLTEKERTEARNRYRFDAMRPGQYQSITWITKEGKTPI